MNLSNFLRRRRRWPMASFASKEARDTASDRRALEAKFREARIVLAAMPQKPLVQEHQNA